MPGGGRLPGRRSCSSSGCATARARRRQPCSSSGSWSMMVAASATPPASLLLMTNVAGAAAPSVSHAVVLGSNELWDVLRARPELRFRLPFLLGVVDRSLLVADDVAGRSTFDIEGAAALARVFVPTRAYAHALEVLGAASLRRPDRATGDGQDGDRAHARPRGAERRLGRARVRSPRGALAVASSASDSSCSSPTMPSARPSTGPTTQTLGARARPRAARPRRASLVDLDLAAGAAHGLRFAASTASTASSASRSRRRSASTPPSSTPPRKR